MFWCLRVLLSLTISLRMRREWLREIDHLKPPFAAALRPSGFPLLQHPDLHPVKCGFSSFSRPYKLFVKAGGVPPSLLSSLLFF